MQDFKFCFERIESIETYPEIGNANFMCALGTFKQQLTLNIKE